MILQSGCSFVVAPRFHLTLDWPERLLLGVGWEESNGDFFPPASWRPPSDDELAILCEDSVRPRSTDKLDDAVCLFKLPDHLRMKSWKLLEHAAGTPGDTSAAGFEAFVSQVVDFLAFKGLPLPEGSRCSVVVSNPGQRSVDSRRGTGLLFGLAPWAPCPGAEDACWLRRWGAINLGDEDTSIVLLNLPSWQLELQLRASRPPQPPPATVAELACQFLRACPDYPTVRLILKPGDGYRLPRGGLIQSGYPQDKQEEVDLMLVISRETADAT